MIWVQLLVIAELYSMGYRDINYDIDSVAGLRKLRSRVIKTKGIRPAPFGHNPNTKIQIFHLPKKSLISSGKYLCFDDNCLTDMPL